MGVLRTTYVIDENGMIKKGTMCRMARGEMVRFRAERRIEGPEEMKVFEGLDCHRCPERSDEHTYVFVLRKKDKQPESE